MLIFTDGFDHTTTLSHKWTSVPGGATVDSTAVRTGTNGYNALFSNLAKTVGASQEHATFILGMALRAPSTNGLTVRFKSDSGATSHGSIVFTGNGVISAYNGAGSLLGSSTYTVPVGAFIYVEMKFVLHDSTGEVTVIVNGTNTVLSLTGIDTKNGGTKTVLDTFAIDGSAPAWYVDDLYLCNGAGTTNNDFLGDVKIETLFPSGAGNTTGLTPSAGSNYQCVDEHDPNTSDYCGSLVDGDFDTYVLSNLATTSATICGIHVWAYSSKDDVGDKNGAIMVRTLGTDYEQTSVVLGTGWTYQDEILETNPNTSAAWTISQINSLEAGFKAKDP